MTPSISLYLDVLRIAAALTVFLSHVGHGHLVGGVLWRFTYWGHEAVIVFFVLSGYVIAYCADQREKELASYVSARLSRLYSVILPVVAITLMLDFIGGQINPSVYEKSIDRTLPAWLTYSASLLMLNQSWSLDTHFGSNGAYWSIPYEFWYYFIFGAATYLKGYRRFIGIAIGSLAAGANILILLPFWLLGALSYRVQSHAASMIPLGRWLLFLGAALLTTLMLAVDNGQMKAHSPIQIDGWLWNLIVAACTSVTIILLPLAYNPPTAPALANRARKWIQHLADSTFALYLLHLPVLGFISAVISENRGVFAKVAYLAVPVMVAVTLGHRMERLKRPMRRWIHELFRDRQHTASER